MRARVTVVGAGVIGLTCAVRLAEAGYDVDVLARELPLETTSAVAGGLWLPYLAEPVEQVTRWARTSLHEYRELAGRPGTGVVLRTGHLLGTHGMPPWARHLADDVPFDVEHAPAPGHPRGYRLTVPLIDMTEYLPYLVRRLHAAGGSVTRLPLAALPTHGVVVNCTGIAARAMAADPGVRPVRGQVVRVSDPGLEEWWCDEAASGGAPAYVLPHGKHVVVGGTADEDDWSTTPDPATAEALLARATALVPALRGATVLQHRVGLRPVRPSVRVETERRRDGGLTVHCYGHGGSGVTTSWGCADDVVAAMRERVAV